MYKLIDGGVFKKDENLCIPDEPLNRHWQEYQMWLKEGNEPEPNDIPDEDDIKAELDFKRSFLLSSTDWLVIRHRDQVDGALRTDLTKEDYEEVIEWRQEIRDLANKYETLEYIWPTLPDVLKEKIKLEYPPQCSE